MQCIAAQVSHLGVTRVNWLFMQTFKANIKPKAHLSALGVDLECH